MRLAEIIANALTHYFCKDNSVVYAVVLTCGINKLYNESPVMYSKQILTVADKFLLLL